MVQKTSSEQRAAARQVELISNALNAASQSNGYWLNAAGRPAPRIFSDKTAEGVAISPFNSLILSLHSAERGYPTALYTTFGDARTRGESVLMGEKGVPFNWYNWSKYVNRHNPQDVISRADYEALPEAQKSQYKGVKQRSVMTLFNIAQTSLPISHKDWYATIVSKNGRYYDRVHEKTEERDLRQRINLFIDKMRDNLVPIRKSTTGMANYDATKDAVFMPAPKAYASYHDYVQELLRKVVSATGHSQRLAREGLAKVESGKLKVELADAPHVSMHERLVVEIASAVKMQELGLPAKLSPESMELVEHWAHELRDNPLAIDAIESDVNMALEVMRRAERGEKIEYATLRNNRATDAEKAQKRPEVDSREAAILADIIAHGGMAIADGNFNSNEDRDAFMQKFVLTDLNAELTSAMKMAHDDDPEMAEQGWTDAQTTAAHIAQRCASFMPEQWGKGAKVAHYYVANEATNLTDKATKEFVVVRDKASGIADVILPANAMSGGHIVLENGEKRPFYLTTDEVMPKSEITERGLKVVANELPGMSKAKIEAALKAEGFAYVRFYNKDGVLGYRPDDSFFKGKDVTVERLSGDKLNVRSAIDLSEAVRMATSTVFERVQMLKDDNGKWAMYIKPEGRMGYCIYPDKEDVNRFFTTVKQHGNGDETAKLKQELAEKYNAIIANRPELKADLFCHGAAGENADHISDIRIFKTKDDKMMIMASIDGARQQPREITTEQWQRLWIADDVGAYKTNLAAKMYDDLLRKRQELEHQTSENDLKEDKAEQEKREQIKEEAEEKRREAEAKRKEEESKQREAARKEAEKIGKAVIAASIMSQFNALHAKHPDAVLLFREDDKYVIYKDDAAKAASILRLDLQQRYDADAEEDVNVLTFPHYDLEKHLPKLVRSGCRVAICDQLEPLAKVESGKLKVENQEEQAESRGVRR